MVNEAALSIRLRRAASVCPARRHAPKTHMPRRCNSDKSSAPPSAAPAADVLFQGVSNGKSFAQIVTLNRPKALNALNLNMIRAMYPKYRVRKLSSLDDQLS